MGYYTAEENKGWAKCNAKTVSGAKMVARKRQAYLGTNISVGFKHEDGQMEKVAYTVSGEWCGEK